MVKRHARRWTCLGLVALPGAAFGAPVVSPGVFDTFELRDISGPSDRRATQMAFGPDGGLYVATFAGGVLRYEYDVSGDLSSETTASPISSTAGIAFHESPVHGPCMYLSRFHGPGAPIGSILRLTDADGDRSWGELGEINVVIVDSIPTGLHFVGQIQIAADALLVGIGNRTDTGINETSYSGTIGRILDLNAVPSTTNAAGFAGVDFFVDPLPYTANAIDKLTVYSGTARNPFGLSCDGDGVLWITHNQRDMNPVPQDELFPTFAKADLGFPCANDVVDWRTHPATIGAGFFDPVNLVTSLTVSAPDSTYDPDDPTPGPPPGGLGPHSGLGGLDFYDGNEYPLRFHRDAFIARASLSDTSFTGLPERYEDIVSVDLATGEVIQIADDFVQPADVLADSLGNILIAEHSSSGSSIYRLTAKSPFTGAHAFTWDCDTGGEWFERLCWNAALPPGDRLAPHQWGSARHAVTIDRPGSSPVVTLDRSVTLETVEVGDTLVVGSPFRLTVTAGVNVLSGGLLRGDGQIDGDVQSSGTIAPGVSVGVLSLLEDYGQTGAGTLSVQIDGSGTADALSVGGNAVLAGELEILVDSSFQPDVPESLEILTAAMRTGQFDTMTGTPGYAFEVVYQPGSVTLVVASAGVAADQVPVPPSALFVGSNRPNPFDRSTIIRYELAHPANASVQIHDASGALVRWLKKESPMKAGGHEIVWDGTDENGLRVSSGVYFCTVHAGERRVTRKMIHLR